MAYIRGHFYIWGDGENIHFWHGNHVDKDGLIGGLVCGKKGRPDDNGLCAYKDDFELNEHIAGDSGSGVMLPNYIVEEFCAMYWARMTDEERADAVKRVIEKYGGGNFGADAVMEAAKLPTVMDIVEKNIKERSQ